jgi:hypothetical protein
MNQDEKIARTRLLLSAPPRQDIVDRTPKTLEEAWELIDDAVEGDCGPEGEQWCSDELTEALEMFRQLYAPHMTAKALFPDAPMMWPKSQRIQRIQPKPNEIGYT